MYAAKVDKEYHLTLSLFTQVEQLLETGLFTKEKMFFVSCLTGEGLPQLTEHLMNLAPPGRWQYPPGM